MAEKTDPQANYWSNQISAAQQDTRYKRWLQVGQQFFDRYRLESDGLYMGTSMSAGGTQKRMVYNLLWSNVQTLKPMLYSRLPEPYVSRRWGAGDPTARLAATIAERSITWDLQRDDFDDQAESVALDYAIVGRGTLRGNYEHTTLNTRIAVRQEDREDGEPRFVLDSGEEVPREMLERDDRGFFMLDPEITDERAPLLYQNWKDFILGPGRKWSEVQKHGWVAYRNFMTKKQVTQRFGKEAANGVTYSTQPYKLQGVDQAESTASPPNITTIKMGEVYEIWNAPTREVYWISPGYPQLLDREDDFLQLEGFFNTPRPLLGTYTNDNLLPIPDYAEYWPQANELDQITAKIEQIVEDIRSGGIHDGTVPDLGSALRNKKGGWYPSDNFSVLMSKGGLNGAVQEFDNTQKAQTVRVLYEHLQAVKLTADELSGMIDLFRGQQTQKDETLGQSEIRTNLGGLRINEKQRDFQRYMRDALEIKGQIVVDKFEPERLLEMADLQDLMMQSPDVALVRNFMESAQGKQAMQNPSQALQVAVRKQVAEATQMQEIQRAVALLKDERMRAFKLDIETDATVALDEGAEQRRSVEFVQGVTDYMDRMLANPAVQSNRSLKALAGELLMFMVRKAHVGRSLEEKVEQTVQDLVTAPQQPPKPDALEQDVQRQARKDQADVQRDQQKNQIDAFEAQTDRINADTKRQQVQVDALEAAAKSEREDLKTASDILDTDAADLANGVLGNA